RLMRTLWTQDLPEIETARHHPSGLRASPMPLQKPHPPIWIGGGSQGAFRRVARLGDGWHATASTPDAFREGKQAVTKFWREAGSRRARVVDAHPDLRRRRPPVGGRREISPRPSHGGRNREADHRTARRL